MKLELRAVPTHVLADALARIESGNAQPPWSTSLALTLPAAAKALARLDGAQADVVAALLDAVLEERRMRSPPTEVVWTGPEPVASTARDTAAVVAAMFRDAEREVLVAAYSLDAARDEARALFAPLHASMNKRSLRVSMFFDVGLCAAAAQCSRVEAATGAPFIRLYWPFGPPLPDLYFDPRGVDEHTYASQHAKVVVVDQRAVLVGSANLTDRGQTRNVELGVRIEDPSLGRRITEQWMGAVAAGGFVRCPAR